MQTQKYTIQEFKDHCNRVIRTAEAMYNKTINWDGSMPSREALDLLEDSVMYASGANSLRSKEQKWETYLRESIDCFRRFREIYSYADPESRYPLKTESCFDDAKYFIEETKKELGYMREH